MPPRVFCPLAACVTDRRRRARSASLARWLRSLLASRNQIEAASSHQLLAPRECPSRDLARQFGRFRGRNQIRRLSGPGKARSVGGEHCFDL